MKLSSKLDRLVENIAITPTPLIGMARMTAIDPDTFSGGVGLSPSIRRSSMKGKKRNCTADCDCKQVEYVENRAPTVTYQFVGPLKDGANKDLAHGYHYTKFMSLLQRMVAPLPIVNKPSGIEVIASPALEKGLRALAKSEGMKTNLLNIKEGSYSEGSYSEGDCHCVGTHEGHCK